MGFFGLTGSTVENMSDAELDAHYKIVHDDIMLNKKFSRQAELNEVVTEITNRLTSIYGFTGAVFANAHRFPNYEAGTKFVATAVAKASVKQSAAELPSTVANGVASATSGTIIFALKAFWPLIVVAAVGGVIYLKVKKSI
jgi:hypothetical protein